MRWATVTLGLAILLGVAPFAVADDAGWVTTDGVATLSGDMTMARARVEALNNARSRAIEVRVGSELSNEAYSVRSQDGLLSLFRETRVASAGHVIAERILGWDIRRLPGPPTEPPTVQLIVRLEARVKADAEAMAPLGLAVHLDRTALVEGEPLVLRIDAHEACTLAVFNLAADGKVRVLYPNRYHPVLAVRPGSTCTLPAPEDPFTLRPRPLAGHAVDVEAVKVVGVRGELPAMVTPEPDGTIPLPVLYRWLLAIPSDHRAEANVEYRVVAGASPAERPPDQKEAP